MKIRKDQDIDQEMDQDIEKEISEAKESLAAELSAARESYTAGMSALEELHEPAPSERELRAVGQREFRRGMLLGLLIGIIILMAVMLFRYGTFGTDKEIQGAAVLTSAATNGKLTQIRELLEQDFLYDVDPRLLETMLFKGVSVGLNDPYAAYMTAEELAGVMQHDDGQYTGIGAVFVQDPDTGRISVSNVYPDSPADIAGLREGDVFVSLNGDSMEGASLKEVAEAIRGMQGEFTLVINRGGEDMEISLEAGAVALTQVESRMMDDEIGYMKLVEFDDVTVTQFEEALETLKGQGMKGLIIDLRDNPGGVLTSVTGILDDLLGECLITSTRTKGDEIREIYSEEERLFEGPLAILVNGDSASASELFAGTIQDYKLGPVIGETTYGKGVVQRTYRLLDGSALKLTTEKYLTADGRDIDGVGIIPDIEVTGENQQLGRALRELQKILAGEDQVYRYNNS